MKTAPTGVQSVDDGQANAFGDRARDVVESTPGDHAEWPSATEIEHTTVSIGGVVWWTTLSESQSLVG